MTVRVWSILQQVFLGPAMHFARQMLHSGNMARCFTATTLLLATAVSACASAQPLPGDDPITRLPNAADVVAAYTAARQWIDDLHAPSLDDPASRLAIEGASGVCVVLRRSGRVLGVGVDVTGDDLMVRRAAARAMNAVLSDPALARLTLQLHQRQRQEDDVALTVDDLHADVGRTLVLELEVAGELVPLLGNTPQQIASNLVPGIDGIAIRQNQSLEFLFPAQQRIDQISGDMNKALLQLSLRSGVPLKHFAGAAMRRDTSLYQFRSITLLQHAPSKLPMQAIRGDVVVPETAVTEQAIAAFADRLAQHLLVSRWPDFKPFDNPLDVDDEDDSSAGRESGAPTPQRVPHGIRGDYRTANDQYRPAIAPPLDQALVAFALARYAQLPAADDAVAAEANLAVAQLLRELAEVTEQEVDPREDLAACAAIVYAVAEQPHVLREQRIHELFRDAAARVAESFDPVRGFLARSGEHGNPRQTVHPHTQALLAGAMSRLMTMKDGAAAAAAAAFEPDQVRSAIDEAWQSVAEPEQVALLPWIGWAERDYAQATGQPLARAADLRRLFEMLDASRIESSMLPNEPDLHGGLALRSEHQDASLVARATAQTVRPAAWLASALKETDIVPASERLATLGRHLRTMRFLLQLSVRPEHAEVVRSPERAIGGLRAATWDSDQPVPAQALGLVTAVETLDALRPRTSQAAQH